MTSILHHVSECANNLEYSTFTDTLPDVLVEHSPFTTNESVVLLPPGGGKARTKVNSVFEIVWICMRKLVLFQQPHDLSDFQIFPNGFVGKHILDTQRYVVVCVGKQFRSVVLSSRTLSSERWTVTSVPVSSVIQQFEWVNHEVKWGFTQTRGKRVEFSKDRFIPHYVETQCCTLLEVWGVWELGCWRLTRNISVLPGSGDPNTDGLG